VLIIVEGPDGVGKSTLVAEIEKRILELHPDDYVHVYRKGPPRKHPLEEYEDQITPYRPGRGEHIICDRWHLGELVYPDIFSRVSAMTMPMFRHIELLLQSRGALLIHAHRHDHADHDEQLMERDDYDVNPEMLPLIRDGFRRVREVTTLLGVDHDYATCVYPVGPEGSECADSFIQAARRLEKAAELSEFVTYVGSTAPDVLILGDVRHNSDPKINTSLKPAFVPYQATSGHYLLGALEHIQTNWQFGLANANDVDNPVRLWHRLGQPFVIALGRNASRNLHVPHSAVPHPQYIRRFHNSAQAAYGDLLAQAALTEGDYSAWRP
jgi:hypothetical protein